MALVFLVVAGAAALAHLAPVPFLLEALRPSRSVWRVDPDGPPTIYLTFDDGPSAAWTPPLLDALADTAVRATFFLIDGHITAATAPIVRRMAAEGHAIGLHSGSRRPVMMAPAAVVRMLQRQAARIEAVTGRAPCRLFRPHAGWRSGTRYDGLDQAGYRLAGWTWGMWDWDWWRRPRARAVADRLARKASDGAVVVIHDGHHADPQADRRHAADTVRLLVPQLRAQGFTFGMLCPSA